MANVNMHYALGCLLSYKPYLPRQTYKTLKGQILAGDAEGAMRGLKKLLLYKSTNAIIKH
jgi:hypothetical protein